MRISVRLHRTLSTATEKTALFCGIKRKVPVTPEGAHRQMRMYARLSAECKKKFEENRGGEKISAARLL
jgi:hypothetical protein